MNVRAGSFLAAPFLLAGLMGCAKVLGFQTFITEPGAGDGSVEAPSDAGLDATVSDGGPDALRSGDAADGTVDDTADVAVADVVVDQVAEAGSTCTAGGSCTPSDCETGTYACDGGIACVMTGTVKDGTPCGTATGSVCSAGKCVACNAGVDCTDPAMPCVTKRTSCSTGTSVCQVTGNAPDNSGCGSGKYCYGGTCSACTLNAACSPAPPGNPCNVGKVTACTGGVPTCTDQGSAANAGTACTTAAVSSGVCDGLGSCVACAANSTCTPSSNKCKSGTQTCSSGPVCMPVSNINEGMTCGTGMICSSGSCVACDATSCPNACCSASGCVVAAAQTTSQCGTGASGGACKTCPGPTAGTGGAICSNDACGITCSSGTACGTACVNTNTDNSNCGSCARACPSGQTCSGGTCNCTGATHMCNGTCVSNTDPNNCGTACNTNCPGPTSGSGSAVCAGNGCGIQCSSGTACGNACVACPVGGVCSGNSCVCPSGLPTNCSGTCVDMTSNKSNCGRCSHSCFYGSCNATAGATGGPGCTSWTVAATPTTNAPAAIVSDGTNLIWADTGKTSILEIAVSGQGAVKTLMQNSAFSTITGAALFPMSLGGGKVAWVTTSNVWTVGVDGSSPRMENFTFAPSGAQMLLNLGINSNATWIGVMQESTSLSFELYECPVGGSASSCTMVSGLSFIPVGAATNSTNYYFHDNNTGQVDVMTFGAVSQLGPVETGQGSGMTGGTAVDSNYVYWTGDSYGIRRAQQIGGTVSNVTTFPSGTGVVIATDGTNVYFTTNGSPNFVGYAPVNGSAGPYRIAPSTSATAVVAAGGMVFWLDGTTIYGIGAP